MMDKAASRLVVEGWRFLPHSYALVAQAHSLCLARRGVDLRFVDLPFFASRWKPAPGIFSPADEALLASLRAPEPTFLPQATFTLRPERPDFSAPRSGRRFAFGTAEHRALAEENVGTLRAEDIPTSVDVVTPSRWAALGYERFGLAPERIHVVPHGIDPSLFRPDDEARRATRQAMGVGDRFLFMFAGAMTWNKGTDLLLAAFARVVETEPEARLFLKGADSLYASREIVSEVLGDLPAAARAAVEPRIIYEGRTFSAKVMADLLRAADCYVSPYRAEGFNLPVLEAMGCAVPVICTEGGPTDEFTDPAFAWRIAARLETMSLDAKSQGDVLEPDLDHLVTLMRMAARDGDNARARGALAARHAHARFSWDAATDVLQACLFG